LRRPNETATRDVTLIRSAPSSWARSPVVRQVCLCLSASLCLSLSVSLTRTHTHACTHTHTHDCVAHRLRTTTAYTAATCSVSSSTTGRIFLRRFTRSPVIWARRRRRRRRQQQQRRRDQREASASRTSGCWRGPREHQPDPLQRRAVGGLVVAGGRPGKWVHTAGPAARGDAAKPCAHHPSYHPSVPPARR
jgi:hypothetical protein